MTFQIDDKVRVVNDHENWLDNDQSPDTVFTLVDGYSDDNLLEIDIDSANAYPEDFELVFSPSLPEVPKIQSQFIVDGTRVLINEAFIENEQTIRAAEGGWRLNVDQGGFVTGFVTSGLGLGLIGEQTSETVLPVKQHDDIVDSVAHFAESHNIIANAANNVLGVYRPNLEDRKKQKIPMHMVDDGFPNALQAIAEVMGWARDVKGYKLHDWKNLPNADTDFPSAAARHRQENSKQKALGWNAKQRTDHESNLLHKAHEAFNVLAELELIVTGVIK